MHTIAGIDEILQGRDDRQCSTDRGFVKEMRTAVLAERPHEVEVGQRPAASFLVRCNDVNTALEPASVAVGNRLLGRTVDHDGMRQVVRIDVSFECLEIEIDGIALVVLPPVRQVNSTITEQHRARTRNPANAQIEIEIVHEPLRLLLDLLQQRRTDVARPDQADRNRL